VLQPWIGDDGFVLIQNPGSSTSGTSLAPLGRAPTIEPVYTDDASHWSADADPHGSGLGASIEERFEVLGELGHGGMGRVLVGMDRALRRMVAIKVLRAELGGRADALARFRSEAQIVAQLEHPSIVPIYAAERQSKGAPAYSMKLVRGRTLTEYLSSCVRACKRRENPTEEHALTTRLAVFSKICEAVAYAHARGVVHRDLKPDNVMIGAFGEVYVMDWGVARLLGRADESESERPNEGPPMTEVTPTQSGNVVGTLTHMPPEQARGDDGVGPAADQYALGMILFELVALKPPRPFKGDASVLLRRAIDGDNEPITHRYERKIDPRLRAIIETATAAGPHERYPSVRDLAEDIGRCIRGDEVSVRRDTALQRAGRFMAKHPALVLATVLVFLLLAGFVVVESLLETVETHQRSHRKAEQIADLTGSVAEVARDLDVTGQRIQMLVEGLAAEAAARLLTPGLDPSLQLVTRDTMARKRVIGDWYHVDAFDDSIAPASTFLSDRYGRRISYLHAGYWVAADGDLDSAAETLSRLHPLRHRMRTMMIRAVDPANVYARASLQAEILRDRGALLQFIHVGFENGLLLNYPGTGGFTPDYDPRKRPWYRRMVESTETSFGEPYADVSGSGILLPCNVALRDVDGALLGVVGADMRLSDITVVLYMDRPWPRRNRPGAIRPPLPGWQHSALVDANGLVVTESTQTGRAAGGTQGNRAVDRIPYPEPELVAELATGRDSGLITKDDTLLVYQHLTALGWFLVVRVDRHDYEGVAP